MNKLIDVNIGICILNLFTKLLVSKNTGIVAIARGNSNTYLFTEAFVMPKSFMNRLNTLEK